MVHLPPLPGSPRFDGDLDSVIELARRDALILREAGFPALMIENFGDAPFYPDQVAPITVAAMTRAVSTIASATGLPIGVNVLRNDALAALAIAAATGGSMIRVNVLTGLMNTDQGPIVGRAAEVVRERQRLCPEVGILADVFVKHASPPSGLTIEQAGLDTWERGGADALIVSGTGTGAAPDLEEAARLRKAVPGSRILVGSGASAATLSALAEIADGAIVGSSLKVGGMVSNQVDPDRARELVRAAVRVGWVG
ncbi:MAG: BtpA/SgcQ family protein, partial [Acidimicrobiia bacterium]